jgi:transcriptional regulator with XRE-family HTH domain
MPRRGKGFHQRTSSEDTREAFGAFLSALVWARNLSQAQLGQLAGVSQSAINQYLQGRTIPRQGVLENIADALDLDEGDRVELFRRAGYVMESLEVDYDTLLHSYEAHCRTIYKIRVSLGESKLAIAEARILAEDIEQTIRSTSSTYQQPFLNMLATVYGELGWAYSAFSHLGELWTDNSTIVPELYALGKTYRDPQFYALANHFLGDAHYVMGNRATSIEHLNNALEWETSPADRLHLHRTLTLNWALLGERNAFQKEETEIRKLIQTSQATNFERICETYEGVARAKGYLGLYDRAFDTVQEGLTYFSKMELHGEKPPIRYAQLVRAHIEVIKQAQPHDISTLERIGKNAIVLVQERAPRLTQNITNLLTSALDPPTTRTYSIG